MAEAQHRSKVEAKRAFLLGAAAASLQLLAAVAEEEEGLEDVRTSFQCAADLYAKASPGALLQPLSPP
jgi:hypothetical protein